MVDVVSGLAIDREELVDIALIDNLHDMIGKPVKSCHDVVAAFRREANSTSTDVGHPSVPIDCRMHCFLPSAAGGKDCPVVSVTVNLIVHVELELGLVSARRGIARIDVCAANLRLEPLDLLVVGRDRAVAEEEAVVRAGDQCLRGQRVSAGQITHRDGTDDLAVGARPRSDVFAVVMVAPRDHEILRRGRFTAECERRRTRRGVRGIIAIERGQRDRARFGFCEGGVCRCGTLLSGSAKDAHNLVDRLHTHTDLASFPKRVIVGDRRTPRILIKRQIDRLAVGRSRAVFKPYGRRAATERDHACRRDLVQRLIDGKHRRGRHARHSSPGECPREIHRLVSTASREERDRDLSCGIDILNYGDIVTTCTNPRRKYIRDCRASGLEHGHNIRRLASWLLKCPVDVRRGAVHGYRAVLLVKNRRAVIPQGVGSSHLSRPKRHRRIIAIHRTAARERRSLRAGVQVEFLGNLVVQAVFAALLHGNEVCSNLVRRIRPRHAVEHRTGITACAAVVREDVERICRVGH